MGKAEPLACVILAAGAGTRMHSRLPKVLQPLCGRPLLGYAVAVAQELGAERVLCVVGANADRVRKAFQESAVEFVPQDPPLGTGHAVLQTRERLRDHQGAVLVMYGDHPLFRPESLQKLLDIFSELDPDLALLSAQAPEECDFGRIVRGPDGALERIVEAHEATPEIRAMREVNLGVYVCRAPLLFRSLERLSNQNAKGEYYLTDAVSAILEDRGSVATAQLGDWDEARGVNTRVDLARAERAMRRRIGEHWMLRGVSFADPEQAYVDADVEIGSDTWIGPGVSLRGKTRIGSGSRVDLGSLIENSTLGEDVWLKPHCTVEHSELGDRCIVGPSAHLRPGTRLAPDVRIGNFVEVKNSRIGRGTKADHLSYIGDANVGERVTFACGAITVNYDGIEKRRTEVGDDCFIGCNANLIAPVVIEPRAYVAAGSTITSRVPSRALAVARQRQRVIQGWWDRHFKKQDETD